MVETTRMTEDHITSQLSFVRAAEALSLALHVPIVIAAEIYCRGLMALQEKALAMRGVPVSLPDAPDDNTALILRIVERVKAQGLNVPSTFTDTQQ